MCQQPPSVAWTCPVLFEPICSFGLAHLFEPFHCQRLESHSKILEGTSRDSHHKIVPFLIMVLILEIRALLAFLLVDYSRVCAANASNEVECILLKKIPHPWWSPREAMTGTVCCLNFSPSLCDAIGGRERTLLISEQNCQP